MDVEDLNELHLDSELHSAIEIREILEDDETLRSIRFSNGTLVTEVLGKLTTDSRLRRYLGSNDVNATIPLDSPLWPGYGILHLAVMFTQDNGWDVRLCLRNGCDFTMQAANTLTPLHLAFYMGLESCVKDILYSCKEPVNPANPADSDNISHFHIATIARHSRMVKAFLESGVDISMATQADVEAIFKLNYWPHVPYHLRNVWNHPSKDRYYLDENIVIKKGATPLHIAVVVESKWLAKEFLKKGADPNLLDANGMSAIHRAFTSKAFCLFRSLLWKRPVNSAEPDSIDLKLDPGAIDSNPTAPGGLTHLHVACYFGSSAIVEALLKVTDNVNQPIHGRQGDYVNRLPEGISLGDTPLHVACKLGVAKKVAMLVKKGADASKKNADGLSSFRIAFLSDKRSREMMRPLFASFDAKESPDYEEVTRMHVASYVGDTKTMAELLEINDDVLYSPIEMNSPIWPGQTCLHLAYSKANGAVKLLLKHILKNEERAASYHQPTYGLRKRRRISEKSYRLIVDSNGFTAFHISCMGNYPAIVEKFISFGADVNAPNNADASRDPGYAPSHLAVKYGSDSVLEVLHKHGANLYQQDSAGNTSIHVAASESPDKIAFFLRNNTFENEIRNSANQTVMDVLFANKQVEVEDFLDMLECGLATKINFRYRMCFVKTFISSFSEEDFQSLIKFLPLTDVDAHNRNIIHHLVKSSDRICENKKTFANKVELLWKSGCELDLRDTDGKTPLHYAAISESRHKMKVLLLSGANSNIRDNAGNTPFMCTRRYWFNFFSHYITKLIACDLEVDPKDRRYNMELRTYNIDDCRTELREMKQVRITESFSLCDVLTKSIVFEFTVMPSHQRETIIKYLGNLSIDNLENFKNWLPVIKFQYKRLFEREKLREPALNALQSLLDPRLPVHCRERILTRLDNDDWKNVTRAVSEN